MSEALEQALAEALAHLTAVIDTCDDDVLDPDTAVRWTEHTGYVLDRLAPADRRRLAGLFRQAALREPAGPWRETLLGVPDGFGLDDDRHGPYCDAVADHVARLVRTVRDADPSTPVPTCPGWTLADLLVHHGTTHRWMEHLVRTRATERVWSRDVPLGLPDDPAAYPDWLARAADAALRTLRAADPDARTWSPGADPHVRFFPRRLLFEAVVHLADAELALGREPRVEPGTAADGVEEFLENLPYWSWTAEPVSRLDRDGAALRLRATDTGAAWTITLGGGGFTWRRDGHGDAAATATVEAASGDLLLLLYGRYRAGDRRFAVLGDRTLVEAWASATAL